MEIIKHTVKISTKDQIKISTKDQIKISTKDQIKILILAKSIFEKSNSGICSAIDEAMMIYGFPFVTNIENAIPIYTLKNAKLACTIKYVELPGPKFSGYWWDVDNSESRIAFLDWMIDTLNESI